MLYLVMPDALGQLRGDQIKAYAEHAQSLTSPSGSVFLGPKIELIAGFRIYKYLGIYKSIAPLYTPSSRSITRVFGGVGYGSIRSH